MIDRKSNKCLAEMLLGEAFVDFPLQEVLVLAKKSPVIIPYEVGN